ncbi:hypothetical protein HYALB_00011617 [Hymenoscyphus albidus]|uniref:Uncharacterized protein n=1 Tax=Hymenoscyphus albidus TaxID=595503 RepID=A0A9N9LJ48_9HELO|nr:hypothetical protein HYALB_00011617 [Hymenoscyphus albidus]
MARSCTSYEIRYSCGHVEERFVHASGCPKNGTCKVKVETSSVNEICPNASSKAACMLFGGNQLHFALLKALFLGFGGEKIVRQKRRDMHEATCGIPHRHLKEIM